MSRRSGAEDWLIRVKVSWAEQIAAKDSDYGDYAGASEQDAYMLAKIDTILHLVPCTNPICKLLKLARIYLIQKKKANFCSVGMGELSKLGALKGGKPFDLDALLEP